MKGTIVFSKRARGARNVRKVRKVRKVRGNEVEGN